MTRVGITGHQRLENPGDWPWVEQALRTELAKLPPPLLGLTSLAIGADQMFARVVLERGGKILAVLPFKDIERTFPPEFLPGYRKLVARAVVETLDTPGADSDAYLAAGRRVVDTSDVMLAVWDGKPQESRGGTADIISYATARGVVVIHINPEARSIRQLGTDSR